MNLKIIAISVNFPGIVKALKSGTDLGMWDLIVLDEKPAKIPKADVYILGAWHPAYSQLLNKLPKDSKIAVLWASSTGEMDLEPIEVENLAKIMENKRIDHVLFSTKALAESFEKGIFFPYPITAKCPLFKGDTEKEDIITLLCPPTMKKNILNQLIAVKLLQKMKKMELHTNLKPYEKVMGWLGLNFKMHGWLPEEDYYLLLSQSKCNLGASWAESFNYQVLEAALCNTFSVVSNAVWWYPDKDLIVSNPNNPYEILEKMFKCIEKNEKKSIGELLEKVLPLIKNNNSVLRKTLRQKLY